MERKPKPRIKDYMTRTLFFSMSVSYLGYFQYGYTVLLMHHTTSAAYSHMTIEDPNSLKNIWTIKLPVVIFFPSGAFTGILTFAHLADTYGRKSVLLLSNTLTFVASILLYVFSSSRHFKFSLFVNFVMGICSGVFSSYVPLYLIEISPTPVRGSVTVLASLCFTLGVIIVPIIGHEELLGNPEKFPIMVIILGVIDTICIWLLLKCPESPRFLLIQKKDETKARQVLQSLRGPRDIEHEIRDLQEEDFYESMANEKEITVRKLLCTRKYRWLMITIILMMGGSQLTGVNGMFFYAEKVYKEIGLSSQISNLISLSITLILAISIVVSINLIELWGRRFLLIIGYMACSMTCIFLTFSLEYQSQAYFMSFISLFFIIVFLIGYALGPGTVLVAILGELFTQSSRASAISIGFVILWFSRGLSEIVITILEYNLGYYALLFYWPFCATIFIYLFKMLPETRGKTFVKIQMDMKEEGRI